MGAGIDSKLLRKRMYNRLKTLQYQLSKRGLELIYKDLELRGKNCVIFYSGMGPASNGESFHWLVLRFHPEIQPSATAKFPGSVDYTDFHKRDIPEHSKGCFEAGVQACLQLVATVNVCAKCGEELPREEGITVCQHCGEWNSAPSSSDHPSGLSGEHDVVLDAIHQESLHGV